MGRMGMKMKYNGNIKSPLCDKLIWRLYAIILDGQLVNRELGRLFFLLPGRIYRGLSGCICHSEG